MSGMSSKQIRCMKIEDAFHLAANEVGKAPTEMGLVDYSRNG